MNTLVDDCLGKIVSLVPKCDWPELAFVDWRMHREVMQQVSFVSLCTRAQRYQACYEGDYLSIIKAVKSGFRFFRSAIFEVGRGGHLRLGIWLFKHGIGTATNLCVGACEARVQLEIIDKIFPMLSEHDIIRIAPRVCSYGDLQIAQRFLSRMGDSYIFSCIGNAFSSGNKELVLHLEQRLPRNDFWSIGIPWACRCNRVELVAIALQRGITAEALRKALKNSLYTENLELIKLLIHSGAELDSDMSHAAFASGSIEIVEYFISETNNNVLWDRALVGGCFSGNGELISMALANTQANFEHLRMLCHNGHLSCLPLLLDDGIDIQTDHIFDALRGGHVKCALELLRRVDLHSNIDFSRIKSRLLECELPEMVDWLVSYLKAAVEELSAQ